jgi:hypothetical protein
MSTRDTAATAVNPRCVFISRQKRGVLGVIKRELRCRSAIETVIGHLKTDGHLSRCYPTPVPQVGLFWQRIAPSRSFAWIITL